MVADVDCTAGGESLCTKVGVSSYPAIKFGDPSDLQDYQGGREFDDLKKFAKEHLDLKKFRRCGPKNLDLCSDAKKASIVNFTRSTKLCATTLLDLVIERTNNEIAKHEKTFTEFDQKNEEQYNKHEEEKKQRIKEVKDSGLRVMKAVAAHRKLQAGGAR